MQELQLVCPSEHDVYFNLNGDGFAEPITGTVKLQSQDLNTTATPVQIQLHLLQTVTAGNTTQAAEPKEKGFLNKLRRGPQSPTRKEEAPAVKSSSILEEVTISAVPRDYIENFPFSIPIPVNTPGTSATPLGKITYSILATLSTPEGQKCASQSIYLARKLIPDRQSMQHTRVQPKSPTIKEVALSQNITTDPKSGLSVSVNFTLRRGMTMTQRDSEFKCTTIRAIHWRLEEVTRLINQNNNDLHDTPENLICEKESTKEICTGKQKGYWGSPQNPLVKRQKSDDDSVVEISLDISLPKHCNLSPAIDGSCYGPTIISENANYAILVEHRLRLEVITGEDTFDVRTTNLVDRRPLRSTMSTSFPLLVGDYVKEDFEVSAFSNPPQYENDYFSLPPSYDEIPLSPPAYV